MALGEYVSVSTQRDTERALLEKERRELEQTPGAELDELTSMYQARGLSEETAHKVAEELTAHDAFAAHVDIELGIDPDELTNPISAALSSAISFTVGALLPLIAILAPPTGGARIPVTFVAVLLALALTGAVSARLGGANPPSRGSSCGAGRRPRDDHHLRRRATTRSCRSLTADTGSHCPPACTDQRQSGRPVGPNAVACSEAAAIELPSMHLPLSRLN